MTTERKDELHHTLPGVLDQIQRALDPAGASELTDHEDRFHGLLDKLEKLPGDERDKLREKDEALEIGLRSILREIGLAGHLPQGTARILNRIVLSLLFVEEILKEIKKLHGIEPAPRPRPEGIA